MLPNISSVQVFGYFFPLYGQHKGLYHDVYNRLVLLPIDQISYRPAQRHLLSLLQQKLLCYLVKF